MNAKRMCPKCRAPVLDDAPEGLCPRCLLQAAAGKPGGSETTVLVPDPAVPAPNTAALPALRYFGDYELLEEIARGGMGVVYKARQSSLNRLVAVKMILAGRLASPDAVKRFRAEAEAAANLQHPNIVAIHEVGEHEGQHYFSMDYVEGRNLAQTLGGKPFPARSAAELVETTANAVHYGHQRGTLHRDLKPQNILIDANGRPRITDFGLAKRIDGDETLTQPGTVMGSPSYMPPEQAAGRQDQIGPQSDVYSLGAILYELLTGQPPFRADNAIATMVKARDEQPVRPSRLSTEVPHDLETICLKCLEKQPERRYSSARALGEDLGRFLKREPILARPVSFARHMEFWARRHPWTLIGAATFTLMILLGFSYYLWEQNSYLRWVYAHPGYVRKPGVRTAEVKTLKTWLVPAFLILFLSSVIYRRYSRRLDWSQLLPPEIGVVRIYPISAVLRQVLYVVGGVTAVFCLYVLMKAINKSVWEDSLPGFGMYFSPDTYLAGALCWFGASLAWVVYREQHAADSGEQIPQKKMGQITPANPCYVTSKLIGIGSLGFFVLYFANVWLPDLHAQGKVLAGEFAAGFLFGTAIAFSTNALTFKRRVAIVFIAGIISAIIQQWFSISGDLGAHGPYLPVYLGSLLLAVTLTRHLLQHPKMASEPGGFKEGSRAVERSDTPGK